MTTKQPIRPISGVICELCVDEDCPPPRSPAVAEAWCGLAERMVPLCRAHLVCWNDETRAWVQRQEATP